jgi:hypothetical protein
VADREVPLRPGPQPPAGRRCRPRPGVLDAGLFGAVTLMVMVTTFLAPPLLKWLYTNGHPGKVRRETEGIEDLVSMP